ncbi:hypothetical protein [Sphingomonas sp. OTU376]|uniref:hypothetical protein n=1 Tax=Sphingomonas sp. OTU376 TaxID=3043863 RepID=UPI00313D1DE0
MHNRGLHRSIALLGIVPALATEPPQTAACTTPPRASEKGPATAPVSLRDQARRTGAGNFLGRGLIPASPGEAPAGKRQDEAVRASRPAACQSAPKR